MGGDCASLCHALRAWLLGFCVVVLAAACAREHGPVPRGDAMGGTGSGGTAGLGSLAGAGAGAGGRTASAGTGGAAGSATSVQEPIVPGQCTVRGVDLAKLCGGSDRAACPIESAFEVVCNGPGSGTQLLFDGTHLYAAFTFGRVNLAPFSVVALRIDPETQAIATHVFEDAYQGMWRLDRGMPVLLAFGDTPQRPLTPLRPDAAFERFAPDAARTVTAMPWDAYYSAGDLHVWSYGSGSLLLDDEVIVKGSEAHAATLTSSGAPMLAYLAPEPPLYRLRTWTEAEGDRELRSGNWPGVAQGGVQMGLVAYAYATDQRIVSWNLGGGVATLGTRADLPPAESVGVGRSDCNGRMTVYFPAICPSGTVTMPGGEEIVAHRLLADERAGPWLLTLRAESRTECTWTNLSGCYESRPCDCAQSGRKRHSAPVIALQSFSEQVQTYRLPMGDVPVGTLATTPLADGLFYAALTTILGSDREMQTVVRLLRIRLAP